MDANEDHERQLDLAEEDYLRGRATNDVVEGSNKGPIVKDFRYSFTQEEWRLLEESAKRQNERVGVLIWQLIASEITRLAHIERSRPRAKTSRPVGRPPLGADGLKINHLATTLTKIFKRLRQTVTVKEYNRRFVPMEDAWRYLVATRQAEQLQRWYESQPWTKEG